MKISIVESLYKNVYASSKELSILRYFLMDDVGGRPINSLVNWLNNDNYESAVLNYSYIKKNGSKVLIYAFYDGYEREEHKDRDKFEIEKDELIKIAKQWQDVYSKYIFMKITEEDGIFNIIGAHKKDW